MELTTVPTAPALGVPLIRLRSSSTDVPGRSPDVGSSSIAAIRLTAIDGSKTHAGAHAPFLALMDVVRAVSLTIHASLWLRWTGPESAKFEAHLLLTTIDGGDSTELEAIVRTVMNLFHTPSSPWTVTLVDPDLLDLPQRGDVRFIRQTTTEVETPDGRREIAPARFANPGPGAWDRLIASMSAIMFRVDLMMTVTPTLLTPDEEQRLEHLRHAEVDHADELSRARIQATTADAVASYRTSTSVLQLMVVGERGLADASVGAIAAALTAPFDTVNGEGYRVAASPRRLMGGGYAIDPARADVATLRLMADGRPWIGTGDRRLEDLVTVDELSFLFSWPVGSDGRLAGVPEGDDVVTETVATDTSIELGHLADGTPLHIDLLDRSQHIAVVGGSGCGKTTLQVSWATQDVTAGRGLWAIDVSGDIQHRLAAAVPAERRDRVIVLDFTDPDLSDSIDLLHLTADPVRRHGFLRAVHDGLVVDLNKDFHGPVGFQNLDAAIFAAAELGLSIADVPSILTDGAVAERAATELERLGGADRTQCAGVLRRLHKGSADQANDLQRWVVAKTPVLTSSGVASVLGARTPTHRIDDLIAPGAVVLIRPPHDQESARLITSVLLAVLGEATRRRTLRDELMCVYLDEAQRADGAVLVQLMNEARKRNIAVHVATQHLGNMPRSGEGIITNAATVLVGRTRGAWRRRMEEDLDLGVGSLARLRNLQFRGQVSVAGATVGPLLLEIAAGGYDPGEWPEWLADRLQAQAIRPDTDDTPTEPVEEGRGELPDYLAKWAAKRRGASDAA